LDVDALLRTLGLFLEPDALSRAQCSTLVEAARSFAWSPATVGGEAREVAQDTRNTLVTHMATDHASLIDQVLDRVRPRLESQFDMPLGDFEPPQLLRYRPGHFFVPHVDAGEDSLSSRRRVSISLLLSDQTHELGGYSGGGLRFYGSMYAHPDRSLVVPCVPRAGTLVGFPSTLLHEVAPITVGERFSIVTWFHHADR
jgi:SM-20-related protein